MENVGTIGEKPRRKRGRPSNAELAKIPELQACTPDYLLKWLNERKIWRRLITSPDDSIVLRAIIYLTDKRDGKPAQSLNVTNQSIVIGVNDVKRAREIAEELRRSLNLRLETGPSKPLLADELIARELTPVTKELTGEEKAQHNALGDPGGI